MMNEDYTVGALMGIPVFCVNREFEYSTASIHAKKQFTFKFNNGYGGSVVEFADKKMSGGHKYELAVLQYHGADSNLTYDTPVTSDVERGDAMYMHELLLKIEALRGDSAGD